MTQSAKVLAYLQSGKAITPLKAQAEFNVFRLAAVINKLRDEGHAIDTEIRKSMAGSKYAEYRLSAKQDAGRGSYNLMGW